jgi:pSer/pThr/pTyr-binding forkhead associated (FHA) protein
VDLGSANGTLLNGRVLVPNQPYPLQLQDVIGFVAADPIEYRMVQFTGYTY